MYKDCYRSYDDLRAILLERMECICSDLGWGWGAMCPDDLANGLAKWMLDNGYEISRYEMDDDYIDGLRKELREDAESGFAGEERERLTGPDWRKGEVVGLNIKDLIMPPVKLDRCPEDILREEIEK